MSFFVVILVSGICLWAHGVSVQSWTTCRCCLPFDQMINLGCPFILLKVDRTSLSCVGSLVTSAHIMLHTHKDS